MQQVLLCDTSVGLQGLLSILFVSLLSNSLNPFVYAIVTLSLWFLPWLGRDEGVRAKGTRPAINSSKCIIILHIERKIEGVFFRNFYVACVCVCFFCCCCYQRSWKKTGEVDFINISTRRMRSKSFFWQMAFGKGQTILANNALNWQISPCILGKFHKHSLRQNVVEIDGGIFCQTLFDSYFLPRKQSLLKSTRGCLFLTSILECDDVRWKTKSFVYLSLLSAVLGTCFFVS